MTNEKEQGHWEEMKESVPVFEFEKEGDFLEGKLVNIEHDIGKDDYTLYTFELGGDVKKKIFGCFVINKLLDDKENIGKRIRIVYKGKKPSKKTPGREWKDFDIFKFKKDEEE